MRKHKDVQNISTGARPVRVAYLIDPAKAEHNHMDAITNEAFSRWGGRRTLLVPLAEGRILSGYDHWLEHFDADIICSFEALSSEVIVEVNERYAPLHFRKIELEGARSNKIQLPINCLSSLSVLPDLSKANVNLNIGPRPRKILSRDPNSENIPFLKRNFGFLMDVFDTGTQGSQDTNTYTSVSLIDESTLSDRKIGKEREAIHKTSVEDIFDALINIPEILTCAQLSEIYAPYNYAEYNSQKSSFTLVVGNSVRDRLLAWNMHLLVAQSLSSQIASLHLTSEEIQDDFLNKILKIIKKHSFHTGNQATLELSSVSLDLDTLEGIAKNLRTLDGCWTTISVVEREDVGEIVPNPQSFKQSGWTFGGWLDPKQGTASSEYEGNRSAIPVAKPHHISGFHPASPLNEGHWMLDIQLDRHVDHCGVSNIRHEWLFPRTLRIDRAFEVVFEPTNFSRENTRIDRKSRLSFAIDKQIARASILAPSDTDALFMAVSSDFEWQPFEHYQQNSQVGRKRYPEVAISNPGRSLTGFLSFFEDLPTAMSVLFHRYWRDEFVSFGATTTDFSEGDIQKTVKALNLIRGGGTSVGNDGGNNEVREFLGRIRSIFTESSSSIRYRHYGQLRQKWDNYAKRYEEVHSTGRLQASSVPPLDSYYDHRTDFEPSVQMLCEREVLFQGREWKCPSCHNKNWVSICDFEKTLTCVICKQQSSAPVAGDWQFRLNPFIIEGYRKGLEPVLWSLFYLFRKSKQSFYFAPSFDVWANGTKISEVDLIAVVDGRTYLVDAKSSTRAINTPSNIEKTKRDVLHITPDVLLFSVSRLAKNDTKDSFLEKLKSKHKLSCEIELTIIDPDLMEDWPYLPS